MEKLCRTCSWWSMHSLDMKLGDCKQPEGHRWWRHRVNGGGVALLDSFGGEETKPDYHCGNWTAPTQPLVDR